MKNKVTLPIIDLGCEIKADVADFQREVSLVLLFLFLKPTHPFWLARCSGARTVSLRLLYQVGA